jgi:hypothetical protein
VTAGAPKTRKRTGDRWGVGGVCVWKGCRIQDARWVTPSAGRKWDLENNQGGEREKKRPAKGRAEEKKRGRGSGETKGAVCGDDEEGLGVSRCAWSCCWVVGVCGVAFGVCGGVWVASACSSERWRR